MDGDVLTGLLLGDDPETRSRLLAAAGGEAVPREPLVPSGRPLRVRLLSDGGELAKLPWTNASYQRVPLRKSGWTVELSPRPTPDQPPSFLNHSLSMPGPVLAVFSRDLYRKGHLDDLLGLFRTLWPRRSALFEATDLDQLAVELRERSPRLLYYFGSGRWDRATQSYLLEMPDRDGGRIELGISELAELLGPQGPRVCFLNLVDEDGCQALGEAGMLLDRTKAVVLSCTSAQEPAKAAEIGFRWMEHLLVHRSDPVIAFHHSGARSGGCWTAYGDWQTSTTGNLDDDLVEYFLDRQEQSEHLLGALGELVNRESPLRVQFRLAVGAKGNRVLDFARQAELYLAENAFAGTYVYPRGPVPLYPETDTLGAVDTAFRRKLGIRPRADFFDALRTAVPDYGSEIQVPLLCLRLEMDEETGAPDTQAIARAVLEWTWEKLAVGCPDDLRIVVLLLMETETGSEAEEIQRVLRNHAKGLRDVGGDRPSFKFRAMNPLAAVDEDHLRDYFQSPMRECHWDLVTGVRQIRKPSTRTWCWGFSWP